MNPKVLKYRRGGFGARDEGTECGRRWTCRVQRGSLGAVRKRLRNTLTWSQQRQSRLADYLPLEKADGQKFDLIGWLRIQSLYPCETLAWVVTPIGRTPSKCWLGKLVGALLLEELNALSLSVQTFNRVDCREFAPMPPPIHPHTQTPFTTAPQPSPIHRTSQAPCVQDAAGTTCQTVT